MKQSLKLVILLLSVGAAIAMYRVFMTSAEDEGKDIRPASKIVVTAQTAPQTPFQTAAKTVIDPDSGKWSLRSQSPAEATIEEVLAPDLPGDNKHAVRLDVSQVDPEKFWAVQILKPVPQPISAKRDLFVRFWGRSPTKTSVWVVFEEGEAPRAPELQKKILLSPEWRQYEIPFRTVRDHTDIPANFCIKAGIEPGVTEVAGIYVDEVTE
ncbi:MAG: hypothetical protein H7Y38_11380 [Armatimonadetes bacterium]|nr:hypothetical protein [Armatimonadota bacterium]